MNGHWSHVDARGSRGRVRAGSVRGAGAAWPAEFHVTTSQGQLIIDTPMKCYWRVPSTSMILRNPN